MHSLFLVKRDLVFQISDRPELYTGPARQHKENRAIFNQNPAWNLQTFSTNAPTRTTEIQKWFRIPALSYKGQNA
jgi:hypothetical protein